jgi:hypothetical protein
MRRRCRIPDPIQRMAAARSDFDQDLAGNDPAIAQHRRVTIRGADRRLRLARYSRFINHGRTIQNRAIGKNGLTRFDDD